jgi:hypothetical protein
VGILGKSSHATTQNKGKQAVLVSTFFYNNTSNNYIYKKKTNKLHNFHRIYESLTGNLSPPKPPITIKGVRP